MTDDARVRLVRRKLGCSNRLIEVYLDDIEGPGGAQVSDFIVLAPRQKTGNLVTGVAILPVLDGNFGLLRIYRHPVGDYVWEVPRGFIESGEQAQVSALRELDEETGLQCDPLDVLDLGTVLPEPGILAARTHIFAATRCRRPGPFTANEMGHEELRFFNAEEISGMKRQQLIEDANTLVALYRYEFSQKTCLPESGV
jgi:ADP-ribose pyrophosphatase YjhB (NUDIX family)